MTPRENLLTQFLEQTDWRDAKRVLVAGDASNRRYDRLSLGDRKTAILMDAPPDKNEDVRPFCKIANHLRDIGLSAPEIFTKDTAKGFLIIEDLGDDLFARIIPDAPDQERPLYEAATDVLLHIHSHDAPDLEPFDAPVMADMVDLAFSWYAHGADVLWDEAFETFAPAFRKILNDTIAPPSVLMHRDYHAENLLWLPDRTGVAQVGLLDFQDAKLAHPAYDLVSLLQDARRDVPPALEAAMIARYVAASGQNAQDFNAAYHVLGAQRNLRIVGVFARLSMHFGKPHYVHMIPRVYAQLMRDIAHPALAPVAGTIRESLPQPTPIVLQKLKDKCATFPTP
ncbi:MAG: aminoglycoside phosphotransferase family protein [Shimia sp.]|uniref:aminoglycoside phosphotransferase family protein n=1 Tax=Shimia sp. TaxID=1954381 RepID=UPI00405A1C01